MMILSLIVTLTDSPILPPSPVEMASSPLSAYYGNALTVESDAEIQTGLDQLIRDIEKYRSQIRIVKTN